MRAFLLFLCGVVLVACKRKDTDSPDVVISLPTANSHYAEGDAVPVRASITDNERLEFVAVTLVSQGLSPVQRTQEYSTSGTEFELDDAFTITDFAETTGSYWLRVRASDGENETNEYVELIVEAEPLARQAVILAEESNGQVLLESLLPDQSLDAVTTVVSDFSGLGVHSAEQQIIVAGMHTPAVVGIDYATGANIWTETTLDNDPFPTITSLSHYEDRSYASYRIGFVWGHDRSGGIQHVSQMDTEWFPLQSYLYDDWLLVVEQRQNSTAKQLAAYWSFSGEIAQRVDLPLDEVVGFARSADNAQQVYVAGNVNGEGRLLLYYVNENDFGTVNQGPEQALNCMAELAPGQLLFGSADDLHYYQAATNLTSDLQVGSGANHLAIDGLNQEIFAANGASVRAYSFEFEQLYEVNTTGPVDGMGVLYNR